MNTRRHFPVTVAATVAALLAPLEAPLAQDSTDALDEVTVTATRREESLSRVPLSITALSDEALAQRGVIGFKDYAPSVPNLAFGYSGDSVIYSRAVLIRGITGLDTTGLYLDELPLPSSMDPKAVDLERIEVLRGPQGSLFGARSMGGTIRLISKPPSLEEAEASVRLRGEMVSHGGAGGFAQAGGNLPVSDSFAVRASAFYQYEPGVIDRIVTGPVGAEDLRRFSHYDAVTTRGVRLAALAKPEALPWLTVQPQFIFQDTRFQGLPLRDNDPDNREIRRAFDLQERQGDQWHVTGLTATADTRWGRITSATNSWRRQAESSEDFSSFYTWFSPLVGGAEGFESPSMIATTFNYSGFVQELRFASDWQSPFQLVGGAFYSKMDTEYITPEVLVPGWEANLGGGLAQGDNVYNAYTQNDNEELAFYAEGRLELSPQWAVTVGARWFRNELVFSRFQDGWFITGGAPDAATLDAGTQRQTDLNPKFAVEWHPSEETTVYASSSKGFRTGGLNQTINQDICLEDLADLGLTEAPRTFRSDTVQNYELGLKARSLDRRFSMNGAVFLIDWDDIRQRVALPCGSAFTANVGAARSKGFEAEIGVRLSDAWQLGAGIGYTDVRITEVGQGASGEVGAKIDLVPEWNGGLNLEYRRTVSSFDLRARADATYVDERLSTITGTPLTVEPYELFNVRVGLARGAKDVSLFVDNVTDKIPQYGTAVSLGSDTPGLSRLHVGRPRTVGVEFRMTFQ
jgi:iron complex outermembrane receptor protein